LQSENEKSGPGEQDSTRMYKKQRNDTVLTALVHFNSSRPSQLQQLKPQKFEEGHTTSKLVDVNTRKAFFQSKCTTSDMSTVIFDECCTVKSQNIKLRPAGGSIPIKTQTTVELVFPFRLDRIGIPGY